MFKCLPMPILDASRHVSTRRGSVWFDGRMTGFWAKTWYTGQKGAIIVWI